MYGSRANHEPSITTTHEATKISEENKIGHLVWFGIVSQGSGYVIGLYEGLIEEQISLCLPLRQLYKL